MPEELFDLAALYAAIQRLQGEEPYLTSIDRLKLESLQMNLAAVLAPSRSEATTEETSGLIEEVRRLRNGQFGTFVRGSNE